MFQITFHYRLLHYTEYSSLCYTVGPCLSRCSSLRSLHQWQPLLLSRAMWRRQVGREGEGRAQAVYHHCFLQEFFLALEGKALTGTMSSWPGWHNLIKFNNNAVLPWVTSWAGLGEKRKCLPGLRALIPHQHVRKQRVGHFRLGQGCALAWSLCYMT